jgi:hypothetical protein
MRFPHGVWAGLPVAYNRIMEDTKWCTRCGLEKVTSEFYRQRDGWASQCKSCRNAYQRDPAVKEARALGAMLRRDQEQARDPEAFRVASAEKTTARRARRRRAVRIVALLEFAKAYDEYRAAGQSQEEAVNQAADRVPDQWDYRNAR